MSNVIGSPTKPAVMNIRKVVKVNSSVYTGESKKNFDDNWDAIFKKKDKKNYRGKVNGNIIFRFD